MTGRIKYCSSCQRGCDGSQDEGVGPEEARYAVKGRHYETKRPYRANLCSGHVEVAQDEYDLHEITDMETGGVVRWDGKAFVTVRQPGLGPRWH